MAVEAEILKALRSRLIAFAQPKVLPIAFTNRPFTAPAGGQYLRESWIPNRTRRMGVSSDDAHNHIGLYQIDAVAQSNSGETSLLELAASIADHFAVDLDLTSGGITARVTKRPDIGPTMVDEPVAMIPVTVHWQAFA